MEQEYATQQANQPSKDEVARLMTELDERIWNDPSEDVREWKEALRESKEQGRGQYEAERFEWIPSWRKSSLRVSPETG
jgi:hypothetical protein